MTKRKAYEITPRRNWAAKPVFLFVIKSRAAARSWQKSCDIVDGLHWGVRNRMQAFESSPDTRIRGFISVLDGGHVVSMATECNNMCMVRFYAFSARYGAMVWQAPPLKRNKKINWQCVQWLCMKNIVRVFEQSRADYSPVRRGKEGPLYLWIMFRFAGKHTEVVIGGDWMSVPYDTPPRDIMAGRAI